jgi:hypothetical protein
MLDEQAGRGDVVAIDDRAYRPMLVFQRSVSVKPSTPWSPATPRCGR